jgi:hypothetical protein
MAWNGLILGDIGNDSGSHLLLKQDPSFFKRIVSLYHLGAPESNTHIQKASEAT